MVETGAYGKFVKGIPLIDDQTHIKHNEIAIGYKEKMKFFINILISILSVINVWKASNYCCSFNEA